VLGLAVTEHLYLTFPDRAEGELAPMRAAVISSVTLAEVAAELDLGRALRLGKGEEAAGGRERASILADALEAVFGAVYLDGGWDAARSLVIDVMSPRVATPDEMLDRADHKTRLQELTSARFANELPVYEVHGSGPDHAKLFRAVVGVGGKVWGEGTGRSKKEAEQAAASAAFVALAGDTEARNDIDDHGESNTDA
jgi:ribonuclease III